jgi:hypothetical protein
VIDAAARLAAHLQPEQSCGKKDVEMNGQVAYMKTFSAGIKAVLVAGLVGHLLTGTASAQGKVDNSGNPAILAAVQAVAHTVAGLQTTLNALQVQVDALGANDGTPSWDQTLAGASRFLVLSNMSNAAILDRETGLVWERTPHQAPATLGDAVFTCAYDTVGGRQGWRLPTLPELSSLRDPATTSDPRLPPGNPFVSVPGTTVSPGIYFWSSTHSNVTLGPFGSDVYPVVSFDQASPEPIRARLATRTDTYFWCVRGPTNHSID